MQFVASLQDQSQDQDQNQVQVQNTENEMYWYIPFFAKKNIKHASDSNYMYVPSESEEDFIKNFQKRIISNNTTKCVVTNTIGAFVMNKSKTKVLLQSEYGKYKYITNKSLHHVITTIGLTRSNIDAIELCGGCVITQSNVDEKHGTLIESHDPRLDMVGSDTLHCYVITADIDLSTHPPGDGSMRWFDISVLHRAYDFMMRNYPTKLTSSQTPYTESIMFKEPRVMVDFTSNTMNITDEMLLISCITLLWFDNYARGNILQPKISMLKNNQRFINIF